ncbi:metallophosphoesterase family protein [Actinomyces naeslundii]|uniref:Nuclease SbcCD subunit D n=1 Tax=Actinomyces naeslundii (strain ATCC 12104 / DSM 43013 / CCUG 2238 / JCM 8349 / NCTC 10301 / Howell 279) TaxID=1115803 RepID=J3ABL4_ACTNH|nr:hypothetical protein [Actinomyces naeslundii]EJN85178.1 hypothetical protein HMPREF1129_2056 [Actinomyces naeslundii str. Howell 279]
MRILHTSDWHLGRTFHGRVLDDAHAAFADHLVELVTAESVDAVLVAGTSTTAPSHPMTPSPSSMRRCAG